MPKGTISCRQTCSSTRLSNTLSPGRAPASRTSRRMVWTGAPGGPNTPRRWSSQEQRTKDKEQNAVHPTFVLCSLFFVLLEEEHMAQLFYDNNADLDRLKGRPI